jgi:16S rRNA processing protein RimM
MGKAQQPTFLEIGIITRPHGIAGEVKLQTSPEYLQTLEGVRSVYLDSSSQPTRIQSQRIHQNSILLRLENVVTRSDAEALRGVRVAIKFRELPKLKEGEYYTHELVGIQVLDGSGQTLGTVSEVLATGSNDVYVIKPLEGKELLLPAIDSVIHAIDLERRTMSVSVPDGLIS